MALLRQLFYLIKTQLRHPKPRIRGISCLSLCLYGIRVASTHCKDLLYATAGPHFKLSQPRSQSLVPCVAAGGMREYTDFVKEGNFSPMTVLDPDLGMDTEIFAKVRSCSLGSTRATSGRQRYSQALL